MKTLTDWLTGTSIVAATAALLASAPAAAQERLRTFDIPAQPLSSALLTFSRQSDEMVVVAPEVAAGKYSREVRGRMTAQEAIGQLLTRSGLNAQSSQSGGFLIEKVPALVKSAYLQPAQAEADNAHMRREERQQGSAQAGAGAMDDIVVVAQRRSERLLDVPISVTAIQGETLAAANMTTSQDLPLITPGLRIQGTAFFVQPSIRGISTTFASATSEANVATYIDGAYQQFTQAAIYDLPDVESVEVLKGPQGTLFGRNATGGAILINTIKPDLNDTHGSLSASYGNFDWKTVKGFVSTPLVADKLAIGLTGLYEKTDGWKHNLLANGKREFGFENYLVRGKIRFLPWEGADFTLTGLYAKRDDDGVNYTAYKGNNITAAVDPTLPVASKPWDIASDIAQTFVKKEKSVTLHGDIELGIGTLTTITHYNKNTTSRIDDVDNGAVGFGFFNFPTHARVFTQELVLSTRQLDRFRAVSGLFYYNMKGGAAFNINNYDFNIYYQDKAEAIAGFGELTYDITDQLSLTGGLRYSSETREGYSVAAIASSVQPPYAKLGEHTWNALTPRVSLLFKATDRTNLYLTYSKGFTSGFFNSLDAQTAPVDPEHVDAFEFGVKSSASDILRWSAAAFYYDYKDLQVLSVRSGAGGAVTSIASNAAKSRIYGAELNATLKVSEDLDLTIGGTYLHARYKDYTDAVIQVPTGVGGNVPTSFDASGKTMIRTPTWSGNVTAHYRRETSVGTFEFTGNLFYSTKVYFDVSNRVVQPDYALLSANLTWQPDNSGFSVGVWGKNLTNHAVLTSAVLSDNFSSVDYLPPRTYGVTLGYKF